MMLPVPLILNAIVTVLLAVLVVLQLTVFRPESLKRKKRRRFRGGVHKSKCTPAKKERQEKE